MPLKGGYPLLTSCPARLPLQEANKQLCFAACWDTFPDHVYKLLAAGANIDATDDHGMTALQLSCYYGRGLIVEALLASGADPNVRLAEWDCATPLHIAADCTRPDTDRPERTLAGKAVAVRKLLAAGADPCAADAKGRTPLHVAAEGVDARSVAYWSRWEEWDSLDNLFSGPSPMAQMIDALLAAGARLDAPDCNGVTPADMLRTAACSHAKMHLGEEAVRRLDLC